MTALDALPNVPASALPAAVRDGSPEDRKAYRAALGFEKILLQSLVEGLAKSAGLGSSPYASSVEDALSDSLVAGGGLGLGEQLFHTLRPGQEDAK